jgi:hypothetical protein
VSHCGLAISQLKSILRQKKKKKKNYGNSNIISPMQKTYNLQKILLNEKPKSFKIVL